MARKILTRVGFATLVAIAATWPSLEAAQAARPRPEPVQERTVNPIPSTPEPTGAIVFGLGVGLVVWRLRRSRNAG